MFKISALNEANLVKNRMFILLYLFFVLFNITYCAHVTDFSKAWILETTLLHQCIVPKNDEKQIKSFFSDSYYNNQNTNVDRNCPNLENVEYIENQSS